MDKKKASLDVKATWPFPNFNCSLQYNKSSGEQKSQETHLYEIFCMTEYQYQCGKNNHSGESSTKVNKYFHHK